MIAPGNTSASFCCGGPSEYEQSDLLPVKCVLRINVFVGFDDSGDEEAWETWPFWTWLNEVRDTETFLESSDMDEDLAESLQSLAMDHLNLTDALNRMIELRPAYAAKFRADFDRAFLQLETRAKSIFAGTSHKSRLFYR